MKITAAFSLTAVMTLSSFCYTPVTAFSPAEAEKSISELEELKTENREHIAELQKEIEEYQSKYEDVEADESAKLEYRNALTEKMELQSQNIDYVSGQIDKLDDEISENVRKINLTEASIMDADLQIDENVDVLKKRIRASYMASGDNISSILSGSSSFYDMLAKFELIAKVAEHDNNLIETIQEQIDKLKELKASLEAEQEMLEGNLESEKEKKNEFTDALEELGKDYTATQEELDKLDGVKSEIHESIEERQKAMAEEEEEIKKLASQVEEFERMIAEHLVSVSVSVSESESIAASEAESRARNQDVRKNQDAPKSHAVLKELLKNQDVLLKNQNAQPKTMKNLQLKPLKQRLRLQLNRQRKLRSRKSR